ncbi:uncharacterized protein Dana_GF14297 [Drosophila ananassae]|uniref:Uncharacterized protein n=1 Tax=Drosophila ananassae TaxID=7217 RepID=B3MMN5_DROAN|nr:accessory gland-specific peptide 26Ab [Drosophila ananassae]XP_044572401.1 accessory gland-specific peptide 26Ab [Drosophila ananassae]EDV31926.2 uncharacterized protein Dana_GF14297 [Drosophila ananassae]
MRIMHYTGLIFICLLAFIWKMSEAAPYISVKSNSRSSSQKLINGHLRTLYAYNVEDDMNNFGGMMSHHRSASFNSDLMSPGQQRNLQERLMEIQK